MKNDLITQFYREFEECLRESEGGPDFWLARDLQRVMGYTDWRNFRDAIERAKESCKTSGQDHAKHFVDTTRMVDIGSGGQRKIEDVACTRYGAYLVAMNGSTSNSRIAFAQSYFVVQTRKQEIVAQRVAEVERVDARKKLTISETELSSLLMERLDNPKAVARIRSKGDQALYGLTTQEMKNRLGVPEGRPLPDYLPTITLKAKDFANEVTNTVVKKENLSNEIEITGVHVKSNADVRNLLRDRGIAPETLPPEEDAAKVKRRLESEAKKVAKVEEEIKTPLPSPNSDTNPT